MRDRLLPLPDRKFFFSWLACFVGMYALSYSWHALVLNDFIKVALPMDVFLVITASVYFVIALFITILTYVFKKIRNTFRYGILVGAVAGMFIYAVAFVLGIGFNPVLDAKMIAFDLGWQTFEQAFGGLICGYTYRVMYNAERRAKKAQS